MGEQKEIFISYKAEEFSEANEIRMILEEKGFSCWMAPMCISGGASYASEIPQAIRNCKIFLLILSEQAQKSKWIPRELDQAINEEKIILPFTINKCNLQDEFAFYLANVQRYEAWNNKEIALNKMIEEIYHILGRKEKIEELFKQEKNENLNILEPKIPKKDIAIQIKKGILNIPKILIILIMVCICIFFLIMPRKVTIAGQEYAKDVSGIGIKDKIITESDFETISSLKDLTWISFQGCTLPDSAEKLVLTDNMYSLELVKCDITDTFVETMNFPQVSILRINDNPKFSNLQVLTNISEQLRTLNISNTGVKDISFLKQCSELVTLEADNLGIQDFSCLGQLTNLKQVSLNQNQLSTLEALSECKELVFIEVNQNKLTGLQGLEKCIFLEEVYASDNNISSLEGLENTTKLKKVNFNRNHIQDISILANSSSNLHTLYLCENQITDINALQNMPNLKYLNLDGNQISDLTPLSENFELETLSAAKNRITAIDGINNLSKLMYINFANNEISDISSFDTMEFNYEYGIVLNLSNNKIEKLTLPNVTSFKTIALTGNLINDYSTLETFAINSMYIEYSSQTNYQNWDKENFSYIYILNCPLNKQVALQELIGKYSINFIEEEDILAEKVMYFNNELITGDRKNIN